MRFALFSLLCVLLFLRAVKGDAREYCVQTLMCHALPSADGVSLAYTESANCRLEANYGHQKELEMIP